MTPLHRHAMQRPLIWLASKSPRRQDLLRQLGVPFELLLPDDADAAEELESIIAGESPNQYVMRVTLAKLNMARAKRERDGLAPRPILCADTTVAIGGQILGKPDNDEHARAMIASLSGKTHRVLTAVAVLKGKNVRHCVQVSRVRFARLSKAQIENYVGIGEGRDKAGSYAIQGVAAQFVRNIDGSPSGIMGLPLYETGQLIGYDHSH